jgi:hypothetical protein
MKFTKIKNRMQCGKLSVRRCVPRKEVTQPVYTRDMKELADEFNIFYIHHAVGVKAAE